MLFRVTRTETTVCYCLVEASSLDEAVEIAQLGHVCWSKDEVMGVDDEALQVKDSEGRGRYVHTKDGYIDPDKKIVLL